jgi:translation initiation factor 2B subunit (eIF-2B alpha/beta/delta family)
MEVLTGIVEEIARDRKRGATALAERALDALARSRGSAPSLLRVRPGLPLIAAVVRLALKVGVKEARRELRSGVARIALQARRHLPAGGRIIVFSTSGTVEAVLRAAGARRARRFPADAAIVGADAIYPGGDFVNAKGTAAFLRRARRSGTAAYAVASRLKRVRGEVELEAGFERVDGRLVRGVLEEGGLRRPLC